MTHLPRWRLGWLDTISFLLFWVTALRLLTVCLSQPIAAYANNYDFVRQSSCVGVWEDYGDRDKTANYPERPVNRIVYDGDRRSTVCLQSSDNLFPWFVAHLAGKGRHTELRMVGLCKAIVALIMLASLLLQPMASPLRCALSVVAALVLGDLALCLYFDTLYLEASVVIFLLMSGAFATAGYCGSRPPRLRFLLPFICAVAWLAFARQQYSILAGFIGVTAALTMLARWNAIRSAAFILAVVAATQWGFHELVVHMSEHTRQVDKANRVDTFLGAVLPEAANPLAALKVAGLPPECAGSIGQNWYSPGFQQTNPCPAVYDLGRQRLALLFLSDWRTLARPLVRVANDSRPSLLPYLGHFEQNSDSGRFRFRFLKATSPSTLLAMLPSGLYLAVVAMACLMGPLGLAGVAYRRIRRHGRPGDPQDGALLLAGLGGTFAFYALLSSAFGDGYYEVQRHALGVLIGFAFLAGAACLTLTARLRKPGS